MKKIAALGILLLFIVLIPGNGGQRANLRLNKAKTAVAPDRAPGIRYNLVALNDSAFSWLHTLHAADSLKVLYFLNRTDPVFLLLQDSLIVPTPFITDLKSYSPFPDTMPEMAGVQKIIIFSYPIQAFAVYEKGSLIRWGPSSMGKESTPSPTGLFHTNWKAKKTISTVNREWIMHWYFNLANNEGVSMHEFSLPGYPASHACLRLLADDAYWLYHWADQWILRSDTQIAAYGTPVIVYGAYAFKQRKPWLLLAENSAALDIEARKLNAEIQLFMPLILSRQFQRDTFLENREIEAL